jgi:hypothetical protein
MSPPVMRNAYCFDIWGLASGAQDCPNGQVTVRVDDGMVILTTLFKGLFRAGRSTTGSVILDAPKTTSLGASI